MADVSSRTQTLYSHWVIGKRVDGVDLLDPIDRSTVSTEGVLCRLGCRVRVKVFHGNSALDGRRCPAWGQPLAGRVETTTPQDSPLPSAMHAILLVSILSALSRELSGLASRPSLPALSSSCALKTDTWRCAMETRMREVTGA